MSFNKIIIVGNLGRDPELRYTSQGTAVCNMSVATTEKRKDASGEPQEFTTWFRVSVWGRQAELCNEYLAKGRQVYIEGRLRLEEYTDKEGNARTSAEVNATEVQFIGSRRDEDGGDDRQTSSRSSSSRSSGNQSSGASRGGAPRSRVPTMDEGKDDDIPF